ncbi:MAG: hypothetical protein CMK06_13435 [Ponticaulis sp.]|nr:hypothetical protein [Ponticaulis sp.]
MTFWVSMTATANAQLVSRNTPDLTQENWVNEAITFVKTTSADQMDSAIDAETIFASRLASAPLTEQLQLWQAYTFDAAIEVDQARFDKGISAIRGLEAELSDESVGHYLQIAELVYITLRDGHYQRSVNEAEAMLASGSLSPENEIRSLLAVAIFKYWNNDFIAAADVTRKAIRAAEAMPAAPPPLCHSIYTVEALVFYKLNDPVPVFQAYHSLYDVNQDLQLPQSTGTLQFNTGLLLSKSGEMEAALEVSAVLSGRIQSDDASDIHAFNAYYLCGSLHFKLGNYAQALDCFRKAEPYLPASEARAAAWAKLIVKSAVEAGEIETARIYFDQLSAYPTLTDIPKERIDITLTEARLLEAEGRFEDALAVQRRAYDLKLLDVEKDIELTSAAQLDYLMEETTRLDEQAHLLETQNQLQQQSIVLYQWLSGLGILILLCVISFLFLFYRKQKDFLRMRDEAVRLSEVKSDFLANMSHEVRTPMNGVLGMTSALRKTPLSSIQSELVGVIERSAEVMVRILDDVLDLSRVESGKLPLELTSFSPVALLNDLRQFYGHGTVQPGLMMSFVADIPKDIELIGDPVRLRQVCDNLITNALKFTETGEITTRFWLTEFSDTESDTVLNISVSDTGIGMDPSQIDNLFKPFTQADTSRSRRYGGTGLGLSISQKIVEQFSGKIDVVSAPGEGSQFLITLPLQVSTSAEIVKVPVDQDDLKDLSDAMRILIVEDHPVNRRVARTLFNSLGFDPVLAEDGKSGIDAYSTKGFDLVLLDIQMPGFDGFQTLDAMRDIDRREGRIPPRYIAFTANAMSHQRETYKKRGFDSLLVKPIQPKDIVEQISTFRKSA